MSKDFLHENDELFNYFLERYFYSDFRKGKKSIELIISPKCNLACKYCYIHKYSSKTFADDIYNNSDVIGNLRKVLHWIHSNKFICPLEIFSGEFFAQEIGFEVMEEIYSFYKEVPEGERIKRIIIPTNFTFIVSQDATTRIEGLIERFRLIGIGVTLSASFDGKYMEQNRPFKKNLDLEFNCIRDDAYYDRVFQFSKKHDFGFHPMIYAEGIENWIQNFDWFQGMFSKHGIDWKNIYLLQVRNAGWTVEQNQHMYKFIQHLITFAYEKCGKDQQVFLDFINGVYRGFNLLTAPFSTSDRGIGCSIQTSLGIRLSDLTHSPCHRLMYPDFKIGEFVDDPDMGLKYKTKNAELGLTVYGFSTQIQPMCIECPINVICMAGCLGSQFETNGDIFSPIRSVCQNHWWIGKAIIDGFDSLGILDTFMGGLPQSMKKQINFLRGISTDVYPGV